jgi:hypothetical protein
MKKEEVIFLFQPKDGVAVLLISNAQPATDGGNYSCRVSTPLDEAAASAQVLVRTTTQPLVAGGRVQRFVGQDVEMSCRADVDPDLSATLQWYKDSVLLVTSGVAQKDNQIEHSLLLAEAVLEDAGDYACRIETSLETVEVEYRLDVYTVPKGAAVSDLAASQEILAVAGRSSELACSAEVDPRLADRARLSWARENVLVGLGNQSLLSETGSHPQENSSD